MTGVFKRSILVLVCIFLGATEVEQRFEDRLLALRPVNAQAYFRLGEDVAEVAETEEDRALAIRLFALADHLDRSRYRRSAILAIQPLVEDVTVRQLLDANLRSWGTSTNLLPMSASGDDRGDESVLAAVTVLSALRRGDRSSMERLLNQEGVQERLQVLQHQLPGDTSWMLNKAASARAGKQLLTEDEMMSTLRVQAELLGNPEQPWSVVLHSNHGAPMTVIDPVSLVDIFNINPNQVIWRTGRWEQ